MAYTLARLFLHAESRWKLNNAFTLYVVVIDYVLYAYSNAKPVFWLRAELNEVAINISILKFIRISIINSIRIESFPIYLYFAVHAYFNFNSIQ